MHMKKTYVLANWKMYLDFDESNILMNQLLLEEIDHERLEIVIFPSTLALSEVEKAVRDTPFSLGAQNVAWVPKGAYTGAVSALLFKEAGASYALVGHSERRYVFGERDSDVRKKFEACLEVGITPVLCIGETKEDMDEGKRQYRLKKQLFSVFNELDLGDTPFLIAYEPVWAISGSGEGLACTPADVEDVHLWIKQEMAQYSKNNVPVLYGGSVNSENVVSYVSLGSVDGVLVGSASTTLTSFTALTQAIVA